MAEKEQNDIVFTKDGSTTLFNRKLGEHYHSTFGAIQESEHIFIKAGLDIYKDSDNKLHVFEVGFGTGLNALLSYRWAKKNNKQISYQSVELYPVSMALVKSLNYTELFHLNQGDFLKMHKAEKEIETISGYFTIQKQLTSLQEVLLPEDYFDVVFFDAFSPDVQPELWTEEIFLKIAHSMKKGGALTTYSCKGIVKRAMKAAGFEIEKLAGPPGKREFLRAFKL